VNPITQDNAAIEGLEYISDLLCRYKVIEEAYLERYKQPRSTLGQRYLINPKSN
jgi:hypothetical protein